MHLILLAAIIVLLLNLPAIWVGYVENAYSHSRRDIPDSGGELARSLLDHLGLDNVLVKHTHEHDDHYNCEEQAVALSPHAHTEHSLNAIVTAAHEVGHAIQDAEGYWLMNLRPVLHKLAFQLKRAGAIIFIAAPFTALLTFNPRVGLLMALCMVGAILSEILIHFVTFPMEWDASFNRAMPLLERLEYLTPEDHEAARVILKACALTYLAGSLKSLLYFWRWPGYLRG